jgi:RNA recognition motif-containing protein
MIMSNHNHTSHHHHHHHHNNHHHHIKAGPALLAKPTTTSASFVGVLTNATKPSPASIDAAEPLVALDTRPATLTGEIECSSRNITSLMSCMPTPNSAFSPASTVIPTKLYVTNFPFTCTQRQIQDLFSRYGQVVECTLKKDYYAYIQYTNTRGAQTAFKTANGMRVLGRKLTVHLATSKKSQSHLNHSVAILGADASLSVAPLPASPSGPPLTSQQAAIVLNNINNTKIVHVRNFPESCSQQQIRECFKTYGEIVECLILHDSYAFVHFKFAQEARVALQATNNCMFMQHSLLVQYSRSKFKQQSQAVVGHQQQGQSTISESNSNENISAGMEEMCLQEESASRGFETRVAASGRGRSAHAVGTKQFYMENSDRNGKDLFLGTLPILNLKI